MELDRHGEVVSAPAGLDPGSAAGVVLVPDRGNPDPRIQGRFPVRFDIGQASPQQEAGLETLTPRTVGAVTQGVPFRLRLAG